MKTFFYIFICFFTNNIYCQDFDISKHEIIDFKKEGNQLLKIFEIQNENSLILNFDDDKFLIFDGNEVFKINYLKSENLIINKTILEKNEKDTFLKIIDSLKIINPDKLNIVENETKTNIEVQDGVEYNLKLFKRNSKIEFFMYSPEVYIENKFPYFREKIFILDAFKTLRKFFYDEEIENIRKSNTVYILVEDEIKYNKINITTKINKDFSVINFHFSNFKILSFNCYDIKSKRGFTKNEIIKNHKDEIITSNILNKYRYENLLKILKNKKNIYLIYSTCRKKKSIKAASLMSI